MLVEIHNRRCWVAGHRCHHGLVGLLLAAIGVVLAADDRRDWRVWIPDLWSDRR